MTVPITKIYNLLAVSHPMDATSVLRKLLISGTILAIASDRHNDDHYVRLDEYYWKMLGVEATEHAFLNSRIDFEETWDDGRKFVMSATVFVDDWAIDMLPLPDAAQSEEPNYIGTGEKRGRKPTIDWQVVWAGVAVILTRQKELPHQEELAKEVAEWCDRNFGDCAAPGVSGLKEKLSSLYRILGGESPDKVFPMGVRPARKRKKTSLKQKLNVGR